MKLGLFDELPKTKPDEPVEHIDPRQLLEHAMRGNEFVVPATLLRDTDGRIFTRIWGSTAGGRLVRLLTMSCYPHTWGRLTERQNPFDYHAPVHSFTRFSDLAPGMAGFVKRGSSVSLLMRLGNELNFPDMASAVALATFYEYGGYGGYRANDTGITWSGYAPDFQVVPFSGVILFEPPTF